MAKIIGEFDKNKLDASFDLDGTVFKFTVLEEYTNWLCDQQIFQPLPEGVKNAKLAWKQNNTEAIYKAHLGALVAFFVEQIQNKSVSKLHEAAQIVSDQQSFRQWNITTAIMGHVANSHNVLAVSLMPEWLMGPFIKDLGFVAVVGSTYVEEDGNFTGEAFSIDKADKYMELRKGEPKLDLHIGDTNGDKSLFEIANRPVLFNPSWTLFSSLPARTTKLISHKDMVTVVNESKEAASFGPPFDVGTILDLVRTKSVS